MMNVWNTLKSTKLFNCQSNAVHFYEEPELSGLLIEFSVKPCSDLDAPSKKDPSLSEFLHWLVVNIHGQSINSGHELASYRGPRPPKGSGPHRYYFLVFKQKNQIPRKEVESRPRFDALAFARQNGMGDPIAGNFFKAQND
ncbi:unnamed protein product [Haemonchus placei]|uniref:Phosphatidylethanolamine-binding protein n=1 Tax=Haemonchus placei TaxID=6290 RepID=A0A0N4WB33_HAEPC|nr:unnamed protein product [Haemonchus placei]